MSHHGKGVKQELEPLGTTGGPLYSKLESAAGGDPSSLSNTEGVRDVSLQDAEVSQVRADEVSEHEHLSQRELSTEEKVGGDHAEQGRDSRPASLPALFDEYFTDGLSINLSRSEFLTALERAAEIQRAQDTQIVEDFVAAPCSTKCLQLLAKSIQSGPR